MAVPLSEASAMAPDKLFSTTVVPWKQGGKHMISPHYPETIQKIQPWSNGKKKWGGTWLPVACLCLLLHEAAPAPVIGRCMSTASTNNQSRRQHPSNEGPTLSCRINSPELYSLCCSDRPLEPTGWSPKASYQPPTVPEPQSPADGKAQSLRGEGTLCTTYYQQITTNKGAHTSKGKFTLKAVSTVQLQRC
jgi:hypothetical protein